MPQLSFALAGRRNLEIRVSSVFPPAASRSCEVDDRSTSGRRESLQWRSAAFFRSLAGDLLANASNLTRRAEFVKAMNLAVVDHLMLDHQDSVADGNIHPSLAETSKAVLRRHVFEMVVTHSSPGGYGHRQHIALNEIVCGLVQQSPRLFTFATQWRARTQMSAAKRALLDCYPSQDSVKRFRYMTEREILQPASTTIRSVR